MSVTSSAPGTLGPGESARLDFKAEEMNDVLKSLTINDQGGKVTGLRYDSSIPLEQKLTEFPFRINNGEPLSAVIDQLKGARIEMEFGPQKIAGAIVSARLIAGDKDHAGARTIDAADGFGRTAQCGSRRRDGDSLHRSETATAVQGLSGGVDRARGRRTSAASISIRPMSKSRDVRAAYIMPMPAWKSSYRLLFDESGAADARRLGDRR